MDNKIVLKITKDFVFIGKILGDWGYISEKKDIFKSRIYRWDLDNKVWIKKVGEYGYEEEKYYFINNIENVDIVDEIENELNNKKENIDFKDFKKTYPFLRDYQIESAQFSIEHKQSLLALSMGLGKTITSLCSLFFLGLKIIVVAKKNNLTTVWEKELNKFFSFKKFIVIDSDLPGARRVGEFKEALNSGYDCIIISYETVGMFFYEIENKIEMDFYIDNYDFSKWGVIFDETYKIKNASTKLYKYNFLFRKKFEYVICLNGTPMENNLKEFYNIINFVKPGYMNFNDFARDHCVFDYIYVKGGIRKKVIVGYKNLSGFNKKVKIMKRISKEDILDNLPSKTLLWRFCKHSRIGRELINDIISVVKDEGMDRVDMLKIYTLLRTVDSYFPYKISVLDGEDNYEKVDFRMQINELREKYAPYEFLEKFSEVSDIIEEIGDNKIIIFTQFEQTAKYLKDKLVSGIDGGDSVKIYKKVEVVSGSLDMKSMVDFEERFKNSDIDIIIATDVWSRGVDLYNIDYLINFDLPLNPSILLQRIDRIHRINSKNAKTIISLVGDGLEIEVYNLLKNKITDFEIAVDNITEKEIYDVIKKKYGLF